MMISHYYYYLATQFTCSSVRDLHVAVLFEIECSRADWGDSFTHLESRILQVPVKSSSRAGLRVRKAPLQFSLARIFNTAPVSQLRTTTVHLGANENGCSRFVLGAGWKCLSPLAIQNFKRMSFGCGERLHLFRSDRNLTGTSRATES